MRMNIKACININGHGVSLRSLRCFDDVLLFAEREEKMKNMLEDLKTKEREME